ncbi:MAG TPA: TetR/AcrR family transcriptional regulator [Acidimicrobiia bacterium]|jgi:AcrR family transcriptional regulator
MKTPPDHLAARLYDESAQILRLDGEVKLDEVATTIGVPRATLYYYFSGRDDLTAYLLTRHLEAGSEVFAPVLSGESGAGDKLRALLEAMIGFLAEHPGVCGGLLSALGSGIGMQEVMTANDRVIAAPLRDLLSQGRERGEFTFDDAGDTANILLGAMLITVLGRAVEGRSLDDGEFRESTADQLLRTATTSP